MKSITTHLQLGSCQEDIKRIHQIFVGAVLLLPSSALSSLFGLFLTARPKMFTFPELNISSVTPLCTLLGTCSFGKTWLAGQ